MFINALEFLHIFSIGCHHFFMKAIVHSKFGPPKVLYVKEIDKPVPKEDEVLIEVAAAEATKSDCEIRSQTFPVKWFALPLRFVFGFKTPKIPVLGGYFSGKIVAVGDKVNHFKCGDHVFGTAGVHFGAYAQFMCLSENSAIAPKPDNMSFEEAAAVPLGGLNALHFLNIAKLKKGEQLLINGAGGSIGAHAIQIAKSIGAKVTAVDKKSKEEFLRNIGADHFIDYQKESISKGDRRYDVVLNMVVKTPYSDCVKILNPAGRYLIGNPKISDMLRSLITSKFTNKSASFSLAQETKEGLLELKSMIEAEKIAPLVDKVYEYHHAAEAHERVETEQRLGVVVIKLGNE